MIVALCLSGSALAADDPGNSAHSPSQAAADVIRDFASADGAFLAAALVKTDFQKDDLSTLIQYPNDYIVVVELTGAQVKQAFERSVSLYPQSNLSFLQISGFEVTFNRTSPPNSRIVSISVNGSKLEDVKTYNVAMPSSLQRGGLGYFRIWDKAKIVRKYEDKNLEEVLKGKPASATSPRWSAQG